MRIAREIVETLRMELGFLKYKNTELSMSTKTKEFNVGFSVDFDGFKITSAIVGEIKAKFDSSVNSLKFENKDISICDIKDDMCLKIVDSTVSSNVVSIKSLEVSQRAGKEYLNLKKFQFPQLRAKFETVDMLENHKLVLLEEKIIKYHLSNFKKASSEFQFRLSESDLIPPNIYSTDFLPEEYVEKVKILNAVKALSEKYNISLLRFYGYYKDIPVEGVQSMKILPNKNIRVAFEPAKVRMFRRKMPLCKDFIVFKYEDRFVYQIV